MDGDGNFDLEELTNFVKAATRTNALQQRIVEGSGAKPGTPHFKACKEAVFKLLATVPGRQELAELKTVFDVIAPGNESKGWGLGREFFLNQKIVPKGSKGFKIGTLKNVMKSIP